MKSMYLYVSTYSFIFLLERDLLYDRRYVRQSRRIRVTRVWKRLIHAPSASDYYSARYRFALISAVSAALENYAT